MHTEHEPKILYQFPPFNTGFPFKDKETRSWTYSLDTYQKSACKEFFLLKDNYKAGKVYRVVCVNYQKEFFIQEIQAKFKLIKEHLRKQGVVAYTVVEITKDICHNPVNRIHYHFLIQSQESKDRLSERFNEACLYAGLQPKTEYLLRVYDPITDVDTYERTVKYLVKYGQKYLDEEYIKKNPKKRIILFRRKIGINKIDQIGSDKIGRWFTWPDGSRATKEDLWNAHIRRTFPQSIREALEQPQKEQRQPVRVHLQFRGVVQVGGVRIPYCNGKGFTLTLAPVVER
jgi:hypothetical protein